MSLVDLRSSKAGSSFVYHFGRCGSDRLFTVKGIFAEFKIRDGDGKWIIVKIGVQSGGCWIGLLYWLDSSESLQVSDVGHE